MRYLIWDFDGTLGSRSWSQALVDFANAAFPEVRVARDDFLPHLRSGFFWHNSSQPHTYIISADQWWDHLAPVLSRAIGNVLAIGEQEAATHLPHIRATYLDPRFWSLFPDSEPCLQAVSACGWQNVLLTNHVPELPTIVQSLGLMRYFNGIFNSADTGYEKPHPVAFARVRAALTEAESSWMIGDNFATDICGARAAGIPGILVRNYHPDAEHFHETLEALPDFLSCRS